MDSIRNNLPESEQKEVEVDILSVFLMLLRKLWLILLVGVIIGAGAFSFAKFMITPTYRAYFTAYINSSQDPSQNESLNNQQVLAAQALAQSYSKVLTSASILSDAAKDVGADLDYKQLRPMVSTAVVDNTQIITVYVVSASPQFAYDYANALARIAPSHMSKIIDGSSMKIIDYARYPEDIFKPNALKYAMIGFAIGVLLIIIFLIIRNFTDDKIKSEADLEKQFSIPVVGLIPDINSIRASGSAAYSSDYSYYGQAGPRHTKEDN